MARARRIQFEGAVYHVTCRGNERKKIVWGNPDRGLFLKVFAEMLKENEVICHAWVLMENHYHLLLETPLANLSAAMKCLNAGYTQKFNRKHHRAGHLFQGRYKAILVDKNVYLKELCRYLVLNPVRGGLVKHPREWAWSSYQATVGAKRKPDWLEIAWLLGQFGKKVKKAQRGYEKFVEAGLTIKNSPWGKVRSRLYLGEEEFLEKMERFLPKGESLDVPKYQKRLLRTKPEEIVGRVADIFGCREEELLRRGHKGNEARDVLIYLWRKESGLNLKEMGAKLGIIPSAVGNRWQIIKRKMAEEKALAEWVEKCRMLS